ncbi:RNA polymerase sigma factor [Microbulbifer hainanensis]|uniref:RNA polymerase sigma factor n=1 Tax=Microbulbifer hainanensis TaxID=2735675 RepID=UPI0018676152|nr:RNA polymerase sigma factor [Microbulbifer hainanensis]
MTIFSFPAKSRTQFERALAPHIDSLYRRAFHLTQSRFDAEELLQDLMLKLYGDGPRLAEIREVRSWAMRALYNLYVDGWRRKVRQPELHSIEQLAETPEGLPPCERPDPLAQASTAQDSRRLRHALMDLSVEHRSILVLHDIEGHSLPEIARQLDIALGTLKSRLHRARKNLRDQLIEMEPSTTEYRVTSRRLANHEL